MSGNWDGRRSSTSETYRQLSRAESTVMDEAVDMNEYGGSEESLAEVSKTLGRPDAPAVSAPHTCEECREKKRFVLIPRRRSDAVWGLFQTPI